MEDLMVWLVFPINASKLQTYLRYGAVHIVRTQPGGMGGQAIVMNFITVKGGGGLKKAEKLRAHYINAPLFIS